MMIKWTRLFFWKKDDNLLYQKNPNIRKDMDRKYRYEILYFFVMTLMWPLCKFLEFFMPLSVILTRSQFIINRAHLQNRIDYKLNRNKKERI